MNFGHYNATLELSFFFALYFTLPGDHYFAKSTSLLTPYTQIAMVNCLLFYLTCLIWKVYKTLHFLFRNEWSENLDELIICIKVILIRSILSKSRQISSPWPSPVFQYDTVWKNLGKSTCHPIKTKSQVCF